MKTWQLVTDNDTKQIFLKNCNWIENIYRKKIYDAKIQFKNGKKAQLQYDKITNEIFILEL